MPVKTDLRRLIVPGGCALLTVAILAPVLPRGFILGYDMSFVPRQSLLPDSLGLGSGMPRAVPADALVAVLTTVIPGDILQKVILFATVFLAALGAARLVPTESVLIRLVAAVAYSWNAFLAERLLIGQWGLLVAYAALPWIVKTARELRDKRDWARLVLVSLPAVITPTGGLLAAGAALAAAGWRRAPGVAAAMAVLNAPWWVPSLLRPGAVGARARRHLERAGGAGEPRQPGAADLHVADRRRGDLGTARVASPLGVVGANRAGRHRTGARACRIVARARLGAAVGGGARTGCGAAARRAEVGRVVGAGSGARLRTRRRVAGSTHRRPAVGRAAGRESAGSWRDRGRRAVAADRDPARPRLGGRRTARTGAVPAGLAGGQLDPGPRRSARRRVDRAAVGVPAVLVERGPYAVRPSAAIPPPHRRGGRLAQSRPHPGTRRGSPRRSSHRRREPGQTPRPVRHRLGASRARHPRPGDRRRPATPRLPGQMADPVPGAGPCHARRGLAVGDVPGPVGRCDSRISRAGEWYRAPATVR